MKKILFAVALTFLSFIIQAKKVVLPEGTIIRVRLIENVDTRLAKPGDLIRFEVLDDVRIKKKVVIKKGAIAFGRLSQSSQGKIVLGKSSLTMSIEYVKAVDDHNVKLNFNTSQNRSTKKGLIKSVIHREITITKGEEFEPFVARDIKIKV